MRKTKIEWCDYVWNPVWGCKRGCSYCFAEKIAKRFAKNLAVPKHTLYDLHELGRMDRELKKFIPTFLWENFKKKFPKKPSIIFVNSMSDPEYWKKEWTERILYKISENTQHQFIILSKNATVFENMENAYPISSNLWFGATCTDEESYKRNSLIMEHVINPRKILNIEPLHGDIFPDGKPEHFDQWKWVIVGRETGIRTGRIIPEPEWMEHIEEECYGQSMRGHEKYVFFKDNMKGLVNPLQMFPPGIKNEDSDS